MPRTRRNAWAAAATADALVLFASLPWFSVAEQGLPYAAANGGMAVDFDGAQLPHDDTAQDLTQQHLLQQHTARHLDLSLAYEGAAYYNQPIQIPGVVQAEFFDMGGDGIAYRVPTPAKELNNVMRTVESNKSVMVAIEPVAAGTDTNAALAPDNIAVAIPAAPAWLRYTVNVPTGGMYAAVWNLAADADSPLRTRLVLGTGGEADPCAGKGSAGLALEAAGAVTSSNANVHDSDYPAEKLLEVPDGYHVLAVCIDEGTALRLNFVHLVDVGVHSTGAPAAAVAAPANNTAQDSAGSSKDASESSTSAAPEGGHRPGGGAVLALALAAAAALVGM